MNKSSLYSRAKRTFDNAKRLRHARKSEKYHLYLNDIFCFPKKAIKKNATTADDTKIRKADEKIVVLNIYIVDLKNKNLTLQNQLVKANKKVMRKHQQICSLKSKIKAEHKKQKVKPEKGVKCNTLQREINDLHAEIYLLIDKNNNIQSDAASNKTVLEARSTDKGIPYNCKVREIYYSLLSKCDSVANVGSIIRTVLSLVDIEITDLPSKSTAANMSSEIGLVG